MLGFLSPEAKFFKCDFCGHLDLADELLYKMFKESSNRPVEKLCKHGWIVIQSGFVGFVGDNLYITPKLTYEQKKWLEGHREEFSYSQLIGLDICIELDEMMFER